LDSYTICSTREGTDGLNTGGFYDRRRNLETLCIHNLEFDGFERQLAEAEEESQESEEQQQPQGEGDESFHHKEGEDPSS